MASVADTKRLVRERIVRQADTIADKLAAEPVKRIENRFRTIQGRRQPFLDEARLMAELIVPGMYEGSAADGIDNSSSHLYGINDFTSANQSLITKGVILLSWTIASVVLPPDGNYFGRFIEASIAQQLEALEEQRKAESAALGEAGDPDDFVPIAEQINGELLTDDIIIRKHIASSNHQEAFANTMLHSLVSGLAVFGHLTLKEAKTYTINNCAVVFDSSHEAVEVIVVDQMPLVSFEESVRRRVMGQLSPDKLKEIDVHEQLVTVYTQQIRVSPTELELRTEIEGIEIPEMKLMLPVSKPAFIPLGFMFMNEADPYPVGWLTVNRGDCFEYENLSLAVSEMVNLARKSIIGLPAGSGVTPQELKETAGLSVVPTSDQKARIEAIVAPIAQNLQQCREWHSVKERHLMMTFGMDFAIQRPGERVTAEEISQLTRGLQRLFGSTYKQIERSFQQKHVRRQFQLAEDAGLVRPVEDELYTLSLTTGLQIQEAQNNIAKMDGLVARAAQLGPHALARFGIDPLLNWYAQQEKIDITGKLLTPDEMAEQLGVGQLLEMVRAMGPQAPGMIAQLLQQATGQGEPTNDQPQ